jgi:hypothetical protein
MSREGSPREEKTDGLESSINKYIFYFIFLFFLFIYLADQPLSGMDAGSVDTQGKSRK